ncbi:MAG: hypothetical protein ACLGH7_07305, partial [Actinomycetes bacterium]
MTENQWPQTPDSADPHTGAAYTGGNPVTAAPYRGTGTAPQDSSPQGGSAGSKAQAAKDEASNVAGEAATAAQGVAQTAKDEAANVAGEAKANARDLLHQAKSGLT